MTRTTNKRNRPRPVIRVHVGDLADGGDGYCVECGAQTSGVEPDARKYRCESCGELAVFGLEQVALEFPELLRIVGERGAT